MNKVVPLPLRSESLKVIEAKCMDDESNSHDITPPKIASSFSADKTTDIDFHSLTKICSKEEKSSVVLNSDLPSKIRINREHLSTDDNSSEKAKESHKFGKF